MKKILYTLFLALLGLSLSASASADAQVQGSRSAEWINASNFEYDNNKKPYHDIQYDAVPNHAIYYQVDTSPTYFLSGTGNNYDPNMTPQIPMEYISFWGIVKGGGASYDAYNKFVLTNPMTPVFIGGHLFNNDVREIGVSSEGTDLTLFTLDGLGSLVPVNSIIPVGTWTWYEITKDGRRKDGNQSVVAPFTDTRNGDLYFALNSFNFWAYSGVFLKLVPVL